MRVVILGAGVIGVNTAWQLLRRGHEVTLVDRQAAAALETSFANAGQISVSYCEPWASRQAPLKMVQWLFNPEGPLKFRPRLDPAQWRWGLQFLGQCHDAAFERNVAQLVALGRYSHAALQEVVAETGIRFDRLTKGIAHYYTDPRAFEEAAAAAELMRRHGVDRRVVDRDELLAIEPALRAFGDHIVGGTYTASDESGDCCAFTQQLAALCERRGMEACMGHDIERLLVAGGEIVGVQVRDRRTGEVKRLHGDAYVVACGSYTAPLLRQVGVRVPIYPGKGYSATLPLLRPDDAPQVSLLDDGLKIAISRLGDRLRVAGTIEVGGYDLSLDTPLARARARMLTRRIEQVFPGVADTRPPEEGGDPRFWCGLRPATPTNVPLIGRTPLGRLWINAGHGTLGWTHAAGSGKALAALIGGEIPALPFDFCGLERPRRAARPASLDPATPS
jgi:D-amino-acid dehydrogenase